MAAPKLDIEVQPTEGGDAYYLPIAARAAGESEQIKIVFRLRITNKEKKTVTLSGISFSFPGSFLPARIMQGVKIAINPQGNADPNDGKIAPGTTATWSNGVIDLDTSQSGQNKVRNEVYLNAPAPPKIRINISCETFSEPATVTMDLVPYVNPTGEGALLLPFVGSDLDNGEYIVTSAVHWANGGAGGTQIFAHDIGIQSREDGSWSSLHSGKDSSENHHYRIWEKPVRALADGTVEKCENDIDDNPAPGESLEGAPGRGNHIWVRHGNVRVLYAHFKKGSIPSALREENTPVAAGQKLGLAGNSGNSSNPHLHLECRDFATNTLRGLPFKRGWVLKRSLIEEDQTGPWVRLTADGICKDRVAIWPGLLPPLPQPQLQGFDEKIYGQVFGAVAKGGGGFILVNGKIIRVPPRGPKWALLQSMIALDVVEQIDHPTADRLIHTITETIAEIARDIARDTGKQS